MSRSREPDSDPEAVVDERVRIASLAIHQKAAREALETIHAKVRTLEAGHSSSTNRIESLEGSRKLMMAIVAAVATAALGAVWTAYSATRESGERSGRDEQRLQQLERDVDRITDQLQRLWTFRGRAGEQQP